MKRKKMDAMQIIELLSNYESSKNTITSVKLTINEKTSILTASIAVLKILEKYNISSLKLNKY
jgi:hypothetical protein